MKIFELAKEIENNGEKFYSDLADKATDIGLKNIFTLLAQDEKKHYIVFESMEQQRDFDPKSAIDFYKGVVLALSNKKSATRTKNAYYKPLHSKQSAHFNKKYNLCLHLDAPLHFDFN